ncbi:hypothetical protein [Aquimarina longa]|uniref:hypothetical protein n=1 Tax=Aquimarina longa TaxID=1080221 RepID=UPI0007812E9C|nr:hypothetical protein [Aquimarina longa]
MEEVTHIDYNYQHAKRFKNQPFLPFVIYDSPLGITKEKRDKSKTYYPIFNGTILKEWMPSHKKTAKTGIYIYMSISIFFIFFLPIVTSIRNGKIMEVQYLFIYLFIGFPFLIPAYNQWKKHKIAPDQTYITLDRINSLITMPKANLIDYFTIPFTHLRATRRAMMHSKYSYTGPELQFFIDTRSWRPWHDTDYLMMSTTESPKATWSFYVWYMDKNRPLPPGSAFDEFREADYKRRKAEGFPPPLFKSLIPTPEATEEQQLVRETFWKDKDYMTTEEEAHYSLLSRKKKKKTAK